MYFPLKVDGGGANLKFRLVWIRLLPIYIMLIPTDVLFAGFNWFLWKDFFENQLYMIGIVVGASINIMVSIFPPIAAGNGLGLHTSTGLYTIQ